MIDDQTIELIIPGTPTGKGRPRFSTRTGHAVTPQKTRVAEARVFEAWSLAGQPRLPDGPVLLTVEIALSRPNAHWKTDGTLSAAGQRVEWPTKKPDTDNVLKLIMDSLNGCAYKDDAQVVHCWVVKRWCHPDEAEHTTVTLRPAPVPLLANVRRAA